MTKLNNYVTSWLSHRNALKALLETISDEQLNFKAWEKGMNFTELVLHTVGSTRMFVQTVEKGAFTPPTGGSTFHSASELREFVNTITDQTKQELEALTDAQLEQLIEFNGANLPGVVMLDLAKDHEIHHKGQLFTYARLMGNENLPFFVSR